MREVTVTTSTGTEGEVGYIAWPVTFTVPETVDEAVEFHGGAEQFLKSVQASVQQSATQNNKTPVAKAAKFYADVVQQNYGSLISDLRSAQDAEYDSDDERDTAVAEAQSALDAALASDEDVQKARKAVDEAIAKHQEGTRKYRPGAPRTASDGLRMTQKQRKELGAAVGKLYASGKIPTQRDMERIAKDLGIDLEALAAG